MDTMFLFNRLRCAATPLLPLITQAPSLPKLDTWEISAVGLLPTMIQGWLVGEHEIPWTEQSREQRRGNTMKAERESGDSE